MSEIADAYLAHMGLEVDSDLKHYGKKGMKWGVRNERPSGGQSWTDNQKKKLKVVGAVALIGAVAVGAYYGHQSLQAHGPQLVSALKSGGAKAADSARKMAAGQKAAEATLASKGGTKLTMDPKVKQFIADTSKRMASDQKGWSESLGISLNKIQSQDAAFIADYIKNYAPKALGS